MNTKDEWVEALRNTPESQHCVRVMKSNGGRRCALGVLLYDVPEGEDLYSSLSDEYSSEIIDMNDCRLLTFAEIADWIELNTL